MMLITVKCTRRSMAGNLFNLTTITTATGLRTSRVTFWTSSTLPTLAGTTRTVPARSQTMATSAITVYIL